MGFWTLKPTISEFHQNFTGPSSISPPSYSVGIFQISQPPFPPEIHKGGWGRWVFGPKNRPPQNFTKILLDVLPHLPHHIPLEFFKYLNSPSPQKFTKGGGVCQKNEQKLTTSEFLKNFTRPSSISPPS